MIAILFLLVASAITAAWNRWFQRVSWRVAGTLVLLVVLHQHESLLTRKVAVPGNLAFVAWPWQALGREHVRANTGIIFTQIAPWTEAARRSIGSGELPLWNRSSASGAPLWANQQTAVLHPFVLITMPLGLGDGFSLSAALRLFASLFFLYVFLRNWSLHPLAALFGAVAWAFSTFNVVWLLFPLGLATMGIAPGLAAVDEYFRRPRAVSLLFLVIAFALPILGGHPESAFWVGVVLAAYGVFAVCVVTRERRVRTAAGAGGAAVLAVALTAVWWLPTIELLPHTTRYALMQQHGSAGRHALSGDWALTLAAPNLLGTPQSGTYQPPVPRSALVLDDYGEIASGYAGALTLGLALLAIVLIRRPLGWFFAGCALFSLLTVTETPGWYEAFRSIPVVNLTLDQRLRYLWAISVAVLGALSLDAVLAGTLRRRYLWIGVIAVPFAIAGIYAMREQAASPHTIAVIAAGLIAAVLAWWRGRGFAIAAVVLTFAELMLVTWRYNPPAEPRDVYPATGAIEAMLDDGRPGRFAALGWSLLAETAGAYGLEDVKTTDPMAHRDYLRFLTGYLDIDRADYDQIVRNIERPFFDFLNVRHVYSPPDVAMLPGSGFSLLYRGADGTVHRNEEALPRYFFVRDFLYEPDVEGAVWKSRFITDFSQTAIANEVPRAFGRVEAGTQIAGNGGRAELLDYRPNGARLRFESSGWNLLVSSDVNWPGWRARLGERNLRVVTVNGAFMGVLVPPASGILEIDYLPSGFVRGAWISLAALIAMIAVLFVLRRREGAVR